MTRCTSKGTAEQLASALQEHGKEPEWVPKFNKPTPRLVNKNAASAAAHDLMAVVSKDPVWSWANNEHSLHPVRQAVAENFALTVKKKYAAEVVEQEFGRLGELEKLVKRLHHEVAVRMHMAREAEEAKDEKKRKT